MDIEKFFAILYTINQQLVKGLTMEKLTQQDILDLSLQSPLMYGIAALWRTKQITWEEATHLMIAGLLEENNRQREKIGAMLLGSHLVINNSMEQETLS